jgi:hypothetical protein
MFALVEVLGKCMLSYLGIMFWRGTVEVQVCKCLQEFGFSVFVEEDGFSLNSYAFKLEVFHPEVFVQYN